MNEHKDDDNVTLSCSVSTYRQCRHTVKWLFEGKGVAELYQNMKSSQSSCSDSVSFRTSHFIDTSGHDLFNCEVTDGNTGKIQLFPFRLRPSGEKPVENMMSCLKSLQTDVLFVELCSSVQVRTR